ncbi:type IX secretion system protein PorG [Chryseobacterium salivictor]|uniref:DUF6089 domain-containing protein n=1 Tax=Chryseobacterium salivictor TaxID=2547600 RepID=A0A4P6ZDD5_9FLAO|nr:DUF6089 family protein [Chryseobacterium salivictor]QBO57523.1 hypothetical protein NBC122_00688 [Chryseobacterium salivictor]
MKIDVQSFMQKKVIYTLIALFFISVGYKGQRHEVGVQLGMSNLVGDIGRTNYTLQKPTRNISDYGIPFYGGILYRMNFNPYQTVRLNLGYSHIQFIDALAKEQYRRNRKLWGTNSILEADLVFEYNFFPVNEEQKSLLSPYIFGGLGAMLANTPQLIVENDFNRTSGAAIAPNDPNDFVTNTTYTSGNKLTMAIPFGVGLKYKFNYNWALFGEFMFRPTFSDSIDYSVIDETSVKVTYNKDIAGSKSKSLLQETPYKEIAEARVADILKARQIGNINSKDWVNSVSIGLSYSFGRPPCYCD